ncbi:hypothetical protein G7072_12580 [Nocardioides sp. HDW12B]|uniref:hypothetical protein n=1 Tax=Nocardioides sp. HDW12B TaxID=2714939 RepID=UPI00140D99BA|nr:hypothetical protein [Nocardioides sp. HDW12B]QIK67067.1 hypothetical protein G7072_12580 [Nocardioides sp. HDW12B]
MSEQKSEKSEDTSDKKSGGKRKKTSSGGFGAGADVTKIRSVAATVIWIVAVVAAAFLAVGALLIVLDFNRQNGFVQFITDTADNLNFLGTLKEFREGGKKGGVDVTKTVLVNWGICAVVWIVAGKIIERLVRP